MIQNIQARCEQFYAERDNRTNLTYHQPPEPVQLAVTISDAWAKTAIGQLTLLWLSSLIIRMGRRYNHLQVLLSPVAVEEPCRIPGIVTGNFAEAIFTHLQAVDPCGAYSVVERLLEGSYVISVGDMHNEVDGLVVRPDGWAAALATPATLNRLDNGEDIGFNPIGAALTAALGAAAVYQHFNSKLVSEYAVQAPLWISALHSSVVSSEEEASRWKSDPTVPDGIDLGKLLVIGAGALGGNALAILGTLKSLRGRVDIVDHDILEVSNLNRLVAALTLHLGHYKAHIAAASLSGSYVEVVPYLVRYEHLLMEGLAEQFQVETYDAVLGGVDQMASRAFIQSGWPRLLIDAGTGGFSWRVSTFPSSSEGACVGCLAGNSQRNYNELRVPMRCAGGQVDQSTPILQHFESYSFVSFFGATFLAARALQRALGILPEPNSSTSTEADALYLAGLQRKTLLKSNLCLCRCGHPVVGEYRVSKYRSSA